MNRKASFALFSCLGVVPVCLMLVTTPARADVLHMGPGLTSLEFVTVGNPGNAPDIRYETPGYGAVNYTYQIGKYEVTNAQYCQFLNAKLPNIDDPDSGAQYLPSDTYGLYNGFMETYLLGGINYDPSGPLGGKFSVKVGLENRPVNHVSWYDSIRYANWLSNGQGSGDTETGTYFITDAGQNSGNVTIPDSATRAHWSQGLKIHWLLPSEDEWYKAAYHKNDGITNHYWDYPTGTDSVPSNDLITPDPGNNANFRDSDPYDWGYTTPDRLTDVGAFENSKSPYGSLDQGGNVFEWNEVLIDGYYRGRRGGFWGNGSDYLRASCQDFNEPTGEGPMDGFRVVSIVASVPEPSAAVLFALGGLVMCIWRGRLALAFNRRQTRLAR